MSQNIFEIPEISLDDVSAFSQELAGGQVIRFENFVTDQYLDAIIDKPWGHEYRIYADMLIDVWQLMLAPGQMTSMHCHPRKETVLLCLQGELTMHFLHQTIHLKNGEYVRIPKGVFHCTENRNVADAHLIEVETPRNKFDLIRKQDKYGRQGQQYETARSHRHIEDMRQHHEEPYVKFRQTDLKGLFHFGVQTGHQIRQNPGSVEFAVSLSLEAALSQRIDILRPARRATPPLKPDTRYFTISNGFAAASSTSY